MNIIPTATVGAGDRGGYMKPYASSNRMEDAVDSRIGRRKGYYRPACRRTRLTEKRAARAEAKRQIDFEVKEQTALDSEDRGNV